MWLGSWAAEWLLRNCRPGWWARWGPPHTPGWPEQADKRQGTRGRPAPAVPLQRPLLTRLDMVPLAKEQFAGPTFTEQVGGVGEEVADGWRSLLPDQVLVFSLRRDR